MGIVVSLGQFIFDKFYSFAKYKITYELCVAIITANHCFIITSLNNEKILMKWCCDALYAEQPGRLLISQK